VHVRQLGFSIGIAAIVAVGYLTSSGQYVPSTGGGRITAPATLTSTSGYALDITTSGTDTDNRGIQVASTWSGASGVGYAIHALMSANSATTAYAIKAGCVNSGGGQCRNEFSDGEFYVNTESGDFHARGNVDMAAADGFGTVTFGLGGTTTMHLVEKHNGTITPTSCGTGPTYTGSESWGTLTVGAGATGCTIPFLVPYTNNAPSCSVKAWVGADDANTTISSITVSQLVLSAVVAGAKYKVECGGH
jgi:hypothetical protein